VLSNHQLGSHKKLSTHIWLVAFTILLGSSDTRVSVVAPDGFQRGRFRLPGAPPAKGRAVSHVPGPIVRHLFRLYPDLLGATGVCWHVDLFTSVCIDDLERGGRIIQPHRLDLGIDREGVSDG
jgi:hypothetical protein